MKNSFLIKKSAAKIIDLHTKIIRKYTALDKSLEFNHMTLSGRNPENPEHYIFETKVHFMVFILKGKGKVYCDDQVFYVETGDVVDVPVNTKFAAEGDDFEYLTTETPAWFPEQAFIVDENKNIIVNSKK
jgi:mannose-6-phosphate isomerase-like protein (cupin superfamily)